MDGSRFDAFARAAASSRRSLLGAALGGLAAALVGGGADAAAKKRKPGQVCRKADDCASGLCLPKNARGRRVCGCVADADCPAPKHACTAVSCVAGACVATEVGGLGAACTPPRFVSPNPDSPPADPPGFPGTGCCAGLVCQGLWYTGEGVCGVNRAPTALAFDVKSPWQMGCIPVTLWGYDPDNDGLMLDVVDPPTHGFITQFVASSGAGAGGVRALPAAADNDYFDCLDGGHPRQPNDGRDDPGNIPVEWFQAGNAAFFGCAEGVYSARTLCYVPFSPTFVGTDSFTYAATDVFGAVSAPVKFVLTVFEVP